jgi:hypothetical protein
MSTFIAVPRSQAQIYVLFSPLKPGSWVGNTSIGARGYYGTSQGTKQYESINFSAIISIFREDFLRISMFLKNPRIYYYLAAGWTIGW